jgi:hypothetical protein
MYTFCRLIGTFEQNNVGVIRQSPLAAATLSLSPESDPQILQACLDRVQSIAETLDGTYIHARQKAEKHACSYI